MTPLVRMRLSMLSAEFLPACLQVTRNDDARSVRVIELNSIHRFDDYFAGTAAFLLTTPATPEAVRIFELVHYRKDLHEFLFGPGLDEVLEIDRIEDESRKLLRAVRVASDHFLALLQQKSRQATHLENVEPRAVVPPR